MNRSNEVYKIAIMGLITGIILFVLLCINMYSLAIHNMVLFYITLCLGITGIIILILCDSYIRANKNPDNKWYF